MWTFQEHLFELEAESVIPESEHAIYVIYPDEAGGNWRIQAVPVSPESFDSRKALPEAWRGMRDEELSKASGIPGSIFIHASGFIGGTRFITVAVIRYMCSNDFRECQGTKQEKGRWRLLGRPLLFNLL